MLMVSTMIMMIMDNDSENDNDNNDDNNNNNNDNDNNNNNNSGSLSLQSTGMPHARRRKTQLNCYYYIDHGDKQFSVLETSCIASFKVINSR